MTEDLDAVAERLRELRAGTGMKQQDVADAVGATRRAVVTWETAKRLPRQPFLSRLAALYDVTAGYIVTGHTGDDEAIAALTAKVDVLTNLTIKLVDEVRRAFISHGSRVTDEVDELVEQLAAANDGVTPPRRASARR